jgi:hypothetical protein
MSEMHCFAEDWVLHTLYCDRKGFNAAVEYCINLVGGL